LKKPRTHDLKLPKPQSLYFPSQYLPVNIQIIYGFRAKYFATLTLFCFYVKKFDEKLLYWTNLNMGFLWLELA